MGKLRIRLLAFAVAGAASVSASVGALAQAVGDFYRGKTITLYTPDTAGSGYDAYARLISRFMSEKIPGAPTIVVQNMPGGGGLVETNYLYNNAPADGTAIAIIMHGAIFRPIFDPREVRYKMDGFRYLGSAAPIVVIGAFNKDAAAQSSADLTSKEVPIGSSGGTTQYFPDAINRLLGAKFKIVSGYRGSNEVVLAMQRNEVAGVVGIGLDSLALTMPLDKVNILFQIGSVRAKELPQTPLIQELAKTDEEKQVLEAVSASVSIGRVFVAPAIPEDRLKALSAAFDETLKDPRLLEQAAKQRMVISPISPGQIKTIADNVYAFPQPVLKRAAEMMQGAY
jgi:tripartite-type tricarboxylate transporter receptor subunit TctC